MLLAVDLGGTAAKLALVDSEWGLTERQEASVAFDNYRTPLIDTVENALRPLLQKAGAAVEGIAVSATGQIDASRGIVAGTNGCIPGYEGTEIQARLEHAFRLPVRVMNDANAALLGEMTIGAARDVPDVVMITLGTGVGGALAVDGRIVGGTRGLAGEIGHMTLFPGGEGCPCGGRGCYERYASTGALLRRAQAELGLHLDGKRLFALAGRGDAAALALLNAWRENVALGIISLVHLLNPQLVLVGGGVCRQEALLIEPLRRRVLSGVMPCFASKLRLAAAALGNDAGLVGAARWWRLSMTGK